MAELDNAHIWAAKLTEDQIEVIFTEKYNDDDTPITEFAKAQGEVFYDHDFFYIENLSDGIEAFFKSSGIPKENQPSIAEALSGCLSYAAHVVVGEEGDFRTPNSCEIGQAKFEYLGKFKHWHA